MFATSDQVIHPKHECGVATEECRDRLRPWAPGVGTMWAALTANPGETLQSPAGPYKEASPGSGHIQAIYQGFIPSALSNPKAGALPDCATARLRRV